MKKVALALSGGVDSATAAMLLLKEGYNVVGVTFRLFGDDLSEISSAKSVCNALNIEHIVADYREVFAQTVKKPFVDAYIDGVTPNPCIFCNRNVKFGVFMEEYLNKGFDFISSGHYARITKDDVGCHLLKAKNVKKDQSYVLYNLKAEELEHILLPLGELDLPKSQLREIAKEAGIPVAYRPESQDICFIPDGKYSKYIEEHCNLDKKGFFVDESGNKLGEHSGYYHYTKGQRKGLGIALGAPAFVTNIDNVTGNVTLSLNENKLYSDNFYVCDYNFCREQNLKEALNCNVKMRYAGKEEPATVIKSGSELKVSLKNRGRAPTAGQSAVFYNNDEVLGGGIIAKDK